ncbi:MAG: DUF2914 domain-containing protein [Candidatus Firestonebacteria bacterium]|nr:DUF2914 domain-containing protein [Candidatus Firestonebacteria bacterium]
MRKNIFIIIIFSILFFNNIYAEQLKIHFKNKLEDILGNSKTEKKDEEIISSSNNNINNIKNNQSNESLNKTPEKVSEKKEETETVKAVSTSDLNVVRGVIAKNIENYVPVGVAPDFPPNVEKLYCYTEISGVEPGNKILHAWYYKDRLVSTIELTLKKSRTYTWSYLKIPLGWSGNWEVHVLDESGKVIANIPFQIY